MTKEISTDNGHCRNCGCDVGDFNYCPDCGYPQKGDLTATHVMQARDLLEEVIVTEAIDDSFEIPQSLHRLIERAWTKLHIAEEMIVGNAAGGEDGCPSVG